MDKMCTKCGEVKDIKSFVKDKTRKDGLFPQCRECKNKDKLIARRTPKGHLSLVYDRQVQAVKKDKTKAITHTRQESYEWATKQSNYEKVFKDWKESGYAQELAPSIDRIDDYKGYSFDNMRLTTWKENREKYYKDAKEGRNTKTATQIAQKTMQGEIINIYHSIRHAARVTGVDRSNIMRVTKNGGTAGGYKWGLL